MSEFNTRLREKVPDKKDVLLREALAYLQLIVDNFLIRTGKSINDLTESEQQVLVDQIDPHLAFELGESKDIHTGLALILEGAGGFLLTDSEGALLGAQQTTHGDVITGVVSAVKAYPVPSRKIILEPTEPYEEIGTYDQSLSAVIILGNAKFHTDPSEDGEFQIVHDLETMQVVVPVTYLMEAHVA
jgi:hypothetical protein